MSRKQQKLLVTESKKQRSPLGDISKSCASPTASAGFGSVARRQTVIKGGRICEPPVVGQNVQIKLQIEQDGQILYKWYVATIKASLPSPSPSPSPSLV
jgi:hypothetical protein